MDQENKILDEAQLQEETEENATAPLGESDTDQLALPDDALAETSFEEPTVKSEAMFPSSLEDEEDFLDEDDGLFTDEELAAFSKKDSHRVSSQKNDINTDEEDAEGALPVAENNKKTVSLAQRVRSAFDIVEMFVFAMAFVLIAMAFCFRHSVVDGGSMENTLHDGEHLIISDLFYTPKQGDIVVVQDLSKKDLHPELTKPIVKRVIATEGQTVMILPSGAVYVDGELLDEDYVYIDDRDYLYKEIAIVVPKDSVFLMGDHRNVSLDSRSSAGAFSEDAILGKVILRFAPLDRFGRVS